MKATLPTPHLALPLPIAGGGKMVCEADEAVLWSVSNLRTARTHGPALPSCAPGRAGVAVLVMKHLVFAFAAALLAANSALSQDVIDFQQLEEQPLSIETADGTISLTVELADETEEIRIGLMNRESMPEDQGMLFDFGQPREANMWMKNTIIPLDMLFMDSDGTVLAIARDAEPKSERRINPGFPVKGVLELNAGASERLGIAPGDIVIHPIFGNAPETAQTDDAEVTASED